MSLSEQTGRMVGLVYGAVPSLTSRDILGRRIEAQMRRAWRLDSTTASCSLERRRAQRSGRGTTSTYTVAAPSHCC